MNYVMMNTELDASPSEVYVQRFFQGHGQEGSQ